MGDNWKDFAAATVRTDELAPAFAAFAAEALELWAGRNVFKRLVSRLAARSMRASLKRAGALPSLAEALSRPGASDAVLAALPRLLDAACAAVEGAARSLDGMDAEGKRRCVRGILESLPAGRIGAALSAAARAMNEAHREDPRFLADALAPRVAAFVAAVDFGEMKEGADAMAEDLSALAAAAGEELWRFPAKMVCLVAMVPAALGAAARALAGFIAPANRLAPDLLADVVFTAAADLRGADFARPVNEISEVIRKLHTGSVLSGDPGSPRLPETARAVARDFLDALDAPLFFRARGMLADMAESLELEAAYLAAGNPALARERVLAPFRGLGRRARRAGRWIDAADGLFSDGERAALLADALAEIDFNEAGAAAGTLFAALNRAGENSPGLLSRALAQFLSSIDEYEAGRCLSAAAGAAAGALAPMAPEVLPSVMRAAASMIRAAGTGAEFTGALADLRGALADAEARS